MEETCNWLFSTQPNVKGFWKIYDLTGRAIKGGSIETVASELNISTADLLPGLYVIRVNGAALKLVVEH